MKKEARLLRDKAINSLILCIEHFNRPWDRGRVEAVLILLDHSFEMLLKASILHRGGRIRDRRARETIGFDKCVRIALDDGTVKFINSDQALTLQMINAMRDAAQHHLVVVSEPQLYMHTQAGVTLFRDLLKDVFAGNLLEEMPARVLPVSSTPPGDLVSLFENETDEIRKLLGPKSRRSTEASARLRALAIMDGSIRGERFQPSAAEIKKLARNIRSGKPWKGVFPGVASIELSPAGTGPAISLRLTKKEGIPVQLVPEGTAGAAVVAVKRVGELDYYNLGRDDLAKKVGLSGPKTTAVIRYLGLRDNPDFYKEFIVGHTSFGRYSQKAIGKIRETLKEKNIDEIWRSHGVKWQAKRFRLTRPIEASTS